MKDIREIHVRFDLSIEEQRQAWEALQNMDRERFHSMNHFICHAVNSFIEPKMPVTDEQTRRQMEEYAAQIARSATAIMEKTLPAFLSGCFSVSSQSTIVPVPAQNIVPTEEANESVPNAEEIPFDYLGEE